MRASGVLKEYRVTGRHSPTDREPNPALYRMRIFASNEVTAKSRFWYFVRKLKKVKKGTGEILECRLMSEKTPTKIKNFGIWLRYDSRSGTHNMYKEFRDLTLGGAVTGLYREMGARHRARARSIQVMKVEPVIASKTRRQSIRQFHDSNIRFPLPHRIVKSQFKSKIVANRPNTFY
uniref:60S ribosomal protein L18a n=1 Tax=Placozoa sp. H4 TaxID=1034858 RepID=M4TPD1_9METZ|nr:60S ribosomal protein L18a [Placozoa sp. H4]